MIQMSVWKPGSPGKTGEAPKTIRRPSGDQSGTSWIAGPKVSWRTWRPLGSMVAMWTPVSSAKSKAILRPSGDQSEKKLGTWVRRRWWVPSGLAAQMLRSPSSGSNRPKVIRPLMGRSPAAVGTALPSTASAMARVIIGSLERISVSLQPDVPLGQGRTCSRGLCEDACSTGGGCGRAQGRRICQLP
jgi:hypothetical protein